MKRMGILVAVCLCLAAGSARADEYWHGPGWYVMAYQYAVIIWSGPYDSKESCEAARPPDGEFEYGCSYLEREPE
jgi:hypothetical protein